jgi:hypothetical protein
MGLEHLKATAARELAKHRLHDRTFGLSATRRRLGDCTYRQNRIEIAEYYARHGPEAAVLSTLLHECAG